MSLIGRAKCDECGEAVAVKATAKGLPTYSCGWCGSQHFTRTADGAAAFLRRVGLNKPAPAGADKGKADAEGKPAAKRGILDGL